MKTTINKTIITVIIGFLSISSFGQNMPDTLSANSKLQEEEPQKAERPMILVENMREPLERNIEIKNIDPENIRKIDVIKKEDEARLKTYINKYGSRAKDGVIILTLKNTKKGIKLNFDKPVISKRKFPNGESGEPDTTAVYAIVEKMPQFPGGENEMFRFLGSNMQYPVKALEYGISGRVICEFVVEKNGALGNIRIKRSSNNSYLDQEAIRVIKSMPKWKPGYLNGQPVRVLQDVPLNFKLQ
jgi:TonB family protein